MNNLNVPKSKAAIADLIGGIAEEINSEDLDRMTPNEQAMSEIAHELLRMERDMLLPGNEQSETERIRRIGEFIERKDFS